MKPATTDDLLKVFWRELDATKDTRAAIDNVRAALLASVGLGDLPPSVSDEDVDAVVQRFANHYDLEPQQITGNDRRKLPSAVRWEVMLYLREAFRLSYPEVGKAVGGRCHKDAYRACAIVRARIAAEPGLRERIWAVGAGEARAALRAVA